jgi:hypothetical protein
MATYKPLQSIALSTTPASVTFSGIDQSYTDLRLVISGRSANNDTIDIFAMRFNGDTGSNYSRTFTYNNTSARESNQSQIGFEYIPAATAPTGLFGTVTIDINNYTSTTANKTVISHLGEPTSTIRLQAAMWRNSTVGINAITLYPVIGTAWAAGSTFDLYGIKSGAPQALGGDLVTTDGNYWYHTFRTTQTFTPQRPLTVDYLVVAGGGGGEGSFAGALRGGGGGGAGGLRSTVTASGGTPGTVESAISLSPGVSIPVTVGAGGTGGATYNVVGTSGSNSQFSTITSNGGGVSGPYEGNSASGGSGGGQARGSSTVTGPAGTSGQGFKGGDADYSTMRGGSGGGAGAAGAAASSGSSGGVGVATAITGTSTFYAGGGGAGACGASGPFVAVARSLGGNGGGGDGGTNTSGVSGTANTGGGGGGASDQNSTNRPGGAGGSGIVIVRYPV